MTPDRLCAEHRAWVDDYEAHDPTAWIVDVDPDEAARLGRLRHEYAPQYKLVGNDSLQAHTTGAMGELGLAKLCGFPKPQFLEGGDGGIDFRACLPRGEVSIDVKTRGLRWLGVRPRFLIVPTSTLTKLSAKWFVLAQQLNAYQVQFIGWDDKYSLSLEPPREVGAGKFPCFMRDAHQLRPMFQFDYFMSLRKDAA